MPDARHIRAAARSVRIRARVIGLRRLAERTAEAHARGFGSEAELAALLVREDPLEARLAHAHFTSQERTTEASGFRTPLPRIP